MNPSCGNILFRWKFLLKKIMKHICFNGSQEFFIFISETVTLLSNKEMIEMEWNGNTHLKKSYNANAVNKFKKRFTNYLLSYVTDAF